MINISWFALNLKNKIKSAADQHMSKQGLCAALLTVIPLTVPYELRMELIRDVLDRMHIVSSYATFGCRCNIGFAFLGLKFLHPLLHYLDIKIDPDLLAGYFGLMNTSLGAVEETTGGTPQLLTLDQDLIIPIIITIDHSLIVKPFGKRIISRLGKEQCIGLIYVNNGSFIEIAAHH
ncbi:hypothetical protein FF38_10547 [Lucilia cuprina]|uniref:Uncharacterized protein n=1 Tax=Lucilia cuprina TaxID=7375 RepID=A0A0L0BZ00_LUCCU|nr:hypothetical protein FF38_10547 [Lucilia cuprina]